MNDEPADLTAGAIPSRVLEGKRALVTWIANEQSIAHGCARVFGQLGADLAVAGLNEKVGASMVAPRDVGRAGEFEAVSRNGLRPSAHRHDGPCRRWTLHAPV